MVLIAPSSPNSRTRPVKVATAPMVRSSAVRAPISAAMSKSSVWTETEAGPDISAARHRREEGDLGGAADRGVEIGHLLIDGDADGVQLLESGLMAFAPAGQLLHQITRGRGGGLHHLLGQ